MWMIAANFRRTHSPSRLAWSEGWRPPGAQSIFIGWTLAMTSVMMTAPWLLLLLLLLLHIHSTLHSRLLQAWNLSSNFFTRLFLFVFNETIPTSAENFKFHISKRMYPTESLSNNQITFLWFFFLVSPGHVDRPNVLSRQFGRRKLIHHER